LILVVLLLFTVVWTVRHAPTRQLWLLAVGVGEWSLWFGVAAVLCIAAALAIHFLGGDNWVWIATSGIGVAVIAITLYPLFSILPLARKYKVPLSITQYFRIWPAKDFFIPYKSRAFTTRVFDAENKLSLDIFLPTLKNANNGASVIVVHGGSWSGGERNDFPRWNEWLAANGFTVFDVDYRLAPQPNFSTATADIKTAVRWAKKHAEEFSIDPDRVALLGRSAGAHLALVAAYTAGDTRLHPEVLEDASVRAVVSLYGPVDMVWAYSCKGNPRVLDGPSTMVNFLGGAPHESDELLERYLATSPIEYVSADTPPTLMVHGGLDMLVSYKNVFFLDEKLTAANVPHETLFIPYGQHGFDYHINGWGSQVVRAAMLVFLRNTTR
jgi:acetyl esterase/lipase